MSKKISQRLVDNAGFYQKFALYNHDHPDLYVPLANPTLVNVSTPLNFSGDLFGVTPGLGDNSARLATTEFVLANAGGAAILYTNATPMPQSLGGLNAGTTFTDEPIQSVLDSLLYPYVSPSVNLGADVGNSLREFGNDIAAINFTATGTDGTNPITTYTFRRGGISQQSGASNTWAESTPVSTNTTFEVEASDGTSSAFDSISYSFVYPFYYGVGAPGLSPASIRSTFGATITGAGDKTYAFAPTSQVYYFAFPQSYGTLTRILDWNGFDITADFTVRSELLTGLDASAQSYYIYEFNNLVSHSAQNLTFDT